MTEQEMLASLAELVEEAYGMQMDFAMIEGVHASSLSEMLSGKRAVTDKVLDIMGLERSIRYRDNERGMFISPTRLLPYMRHKVKRKYGTQTELCRQFDTGTSVVCAHLNGRRVRGVSDWLLEAVNMERVQTYRRAQPTMRRTA